MFYLLLNPIFWFYLLLSFIIIYLYIAQKTKFFQNNLNLLGYSIKITLNFHYYVLIIYIISFIIVTILYILNLGYAALADIEIFAAQETVKLMQPSIDQLDNTTYIKKTFLINEKSNNGNNQIIPSGKEDSSHLWRFFTKPVRYLSDWLAGNQAIKSAVSADKDLNHVEVVKEIIKNRSIAHDSATLGRSYTPEQLNIPADQIPTDSHFAARLPVEIDGESKTAICVDLDGAMQAYNDTYKKVTGEERFNLLARAGLSVASYCSETGSVQCYIIDPEVENKAFQERSQPLQESGFVFSPEILKKHVPSSDSNSPKQNLFD